MNIALRITIILAALAVFSTSAHAAACTSTAAGNWNSKASWGASGCTGAAALCSDGTSPCPGHGDTVTLNHAITQNVPSLIVGVDGAQSSDIYLNSLTGGGGSAYTSCTASLSGGTSSRAGAVRSGLINGVCFPYIYDRGSYTACPITLTLGGATGSGQAAGTIGCNAGGGTPAITIGGSGSITIAADTFVRGTMLINGTSGADAIVMNGNANLYMDMSAAPAGTIYRIVFHTNPYRVLHADCSGSHAGTSGTGCSIQGLNGVTSIESDLAGSTGQYPNVNINNVYFKNVGDANTQAMAVETRSASNSSNLIVQNSIFDASGYIYLPACAAGDTITYSGNYHKNTPTNLAEGVVPMGPPGIVNLWVVCTTALTSGARNITGNVFDGTIGSMGVGSSSQVKNFTISGNYVGQAYQLSSVQVPVTLSNNFIRYNPGPQDCCVITTGDMSYIYTYVDSALVSNQHGYHHGGVASFAFSNMIFERSGDNIGDSGEWAFITTNAGTQSLTNSIFLCSATGYSFEEAGSILGSSGTNQSPTTTLTNNTFCSNNSSGFGFIDIDEVANRTQSGSITLRSNLIWSPQNFGALKVQTLQPTSLANVDVCTTASATTSNCDYNGGYNLGTANALCNTANCPNQGNGYAGPWSFTPGFHDVNNQDPRFKDSTRRIESFDTGYLGRTTAAAWISGASYSSGDFVSASTAASPPGVTGTFGGATFNFRCKAAAGCNDTPKPGFNTINNTAAGTTASQSITITPMNLNTVTASNLSCIGPSGSNVAISSFSTGGTNPVNTVTFNYASTSTVSCWVASNWHDYWEWASLYWTREAVFAQTTYTDAGVNCVNCSVIQALINWVASGFAPTNVAYKGTGFGGSDIGAVPVAPVGLNSFLGMLGPGTTVF